jgi:hypothetical protein
MILPCIEQNSKRKEAVSVKGKKQKKGDKDKAGSKES